MSPKTQLIETFEDLTQAFVMFANTVPSLPATKQDRSNTLAWPVSDLLCGNDGWQAPRHSYQRCLRHSHQQRRAPLG